MKVTFEYDTSQDGFDEYTDLRRMQNIDKICRTFSEILSKTRKWDKYGWKDETEEFTAGFVRDAIIDIIQSNGLDTEELQLF